MSKSPETSLSSVCRENREGSETHKTAFGCAECVTPLFRHCNRNCRIKTEQGYDHKRSKTLRMQRTCCPHLSTKKSMSPDVKGCTSSLPATEPPSATRTAGDPPQIHFLCCPQILGRAPKFGLDDGDLPPARVEAIATRSKDATRGSWHRYERSKDAIRCY